ncbi:MAG: FAD-binding protein [Actinomycetota bacterium]|nr:FAD-binding protein [Actinomycetota bacterium]
MRSTSHSVMVLLWGGHDPLICRQLGPDSIAIVVQSSASDSGVDNDVPSICPNCRGRAELGNLISVLAPPNLYPSFVANSIYSSLIRLLDEETDENNEEAKPDCSLTSPVAPYHQSSFKSSFKEASLALKTPINVDSIFVMGDHRAIGISARLATLSSLSFVGSVASVYSDRIATTNSDNGATYYERPRTCGYVITPIASATANPVIDSTPDSEPKLRFDGRSPSVDVGSAETANEVYLDVGTPKDGTKDIMADADSFIDYRVNLATANETSLTNSEAVLVVGGGLKDEEMIAKVKAISDRLGVALGATRVICDAGLLDHSRQIGTTGITISPKLYIALGVSGQPQHLGGLEAVEEGFSFNVDKGAPINSFVDNAYITDAREVVERLYELVMEEHDR